MNVKISTSETNIIRWNSAWFIKFVSRKRFRKLQNCRTWWQASENWFGFPNSEMEPVRVFDDRYRYRFHLCPNLPFQIYRASKTLTVFYRTFFGIRKLGNPRVSDDILQKLQRSSRIPLLTFWVSQFRKILNEFSIVILEYPKDVEFGIKENLWVFEASKTNTVFLKTFYQCGYPFENQKGFLNGFPSWSEFPRERILFTVYTAA